jgi:orotate phosphoribosyltransferase
VQFVQRELGLAVVAIASLNDLLAYLQGQSDPRLASNLPAVQAYRERYGVRM